MHLNESYGITEQENNDNPIDIHCENIRRKGYTVLSGVVNRDDVILTKEKFESAFSKYKEKYGVRYLELVDEQNGYRMPFYLDKFFLSIALNEHVLKVVEGLMGNNYILNQQNAISNPVKEKYNQSNWHRDLPYSHYTASRPLMLNALYCVDEFTKENGSTRLIPGSHLFEKFPSDVFINENTVVAEAEAGSFIILDSMIFHSGSDNKSQNVRRAINNVYSIPHIKQQIDINHENTKHLKLTSFEKKVLGVNYETYSSVSGFLESRKTR